MRATKTMPNRGEALAAVLDSIGATAVVRRLVKAAEDGGLRPHADADPDEHGRIAVVLNAPGRGALFGVLYVSAANGTVISAYLTHGNGGVERKHERVAEIRVVLRSWATERDAARG
jgi:hypothetical protein